MDATTTTITVELDEDARLWLWHGVFGQRADALLHTLANELPWQQPCLTLYGREHPIPRLVCSIAGNTQSPCASASRTGVST